MSLSATDETAVSTSRKGYGIAFWCMALLIALSVYVGAYFALVERNQFSAIPIITSIWTKPEFLVDYYAPWYSTNPQMHEFLERAFRPIHWIDTRIRDKYWDPRKGP